MSHVKWPIIREWVMSSNLLSENGSCHTWSWRDTLHTGSLLFQNESCQVEYHLKTSHGKKSVELAQVVYYSWVNHVTFGVGKTYCTQIFENIKWAFDETCSTQAAYSLIWIQVKWPSTWGWVTVKSLYWSHTYFSIFRMSHVTLDIGGKRSAQVAYNFRMSRVKCRTLRMSDCQMPYCLRMSHFGKSVETAQVV